MAAKQSKSVAQELRDLKKELKVLMAELEQMPHHKKVSDMSVGLKLRREHEVKERIKEIEDTLIPDLHA